jgi:hypothetical protein
MPNALIMAGAGPEPSNFAPLNTNRIFTGLWTNRSLLRDAATSDYQEHYGMGRQDSIAGGFNSEISPRLTLVRRPGTSVYNAVAQHPITRWYSFNTFDLTSEAIHVMADTNTAVMDVTAPGSNVLFTKTPGAGSTYFLGVGNILYFTNGTDNKQWNHDTLQVWNWGIPAPTAAPTVTQQPRPNTYPSWKQSTAYSTTEIYGLTIEDSNDLMQRVTTFGETGAQAPVWNTAYLQGTPDGSVEWQNMGVSGWSANHAYQNGDPVVGTVVDSQGLNIGTLFYCVQSGQSAATPPNWVAGVGSITGDGGVTWKNMGNLLYWPDIGPSTPIVGADTIVDPNGYLQQILQCGKSGNAPPTWQTELGAYTFDGSIVWVNAGAFAAGATAATQYGYAYQNSANTDLSEMSPASTPITVIKGGQVVIQGVGSADPQCDTIPIYRIAQGGSTFLLLATIANPGAGVTWTYIDTLPDSALNPEIQALVAGEGTPLPAGASCLGYHLGRIFAAVGNVVWISSGPDAVVSGSSGNAGFDTFFTCQSKIKRFWVTPLGMVVLTARDAYLILGSATDTDPLYMVVFIANLPLPSYDAFTLNKTTAYMMMSNNQLISLDPSAGIVDIGYPIADILEEDYPATGAYVTYHSQSSRDSALYVGNGNGFWYRMATNSAPEQGTNWSTQALIPGMAAIQSVEVTPGQYRLLIGCRTGTAPIYMRDRTVNTDFGNPFPVDTTFGNIVLAQPGELAALTFITLESVRVGTRAGLALLLGEIGTTSTVKFETLKRTRQDPPNLPASTTLFSDRYHFKQNQKSAWCRHFQMNISWPAEDAPNELLAFTIFGQTWQEFRSQ